MLRSVDTLEKFLLTGLFRRGLAIYLGKDVSKLKAKGGGKWKYMGSEKAMLDAAERFSPYR